MTEREEAKRRHGLIQQGMKEAGLDLLLVATDWKHKGNLRYLAGRILWSRWAYMIFRATGDPILVMVAPSQRHWALKEGWIQDVRFSHEPITEVARLLKELGARGRVGIAELNDTMRVADYLYLQQQLPTVVFFDATEIVARPRAVKTADELKGVAHSAQIADDAFECFARLIKPGVGHWEIVGEVERVMRGRGVYDTMILLSAGPYLREPTDHVFRAGDFVMFSIELAGPEGYWVEQGGMFMLGQPGKKHEALFEACHEAITMAREMLVPGGSVAAISKRIEALLKAAGFQIGIWGGHGIGLDVLELPLILPHDPGTLSEDMVIAIHPHVVDSETDFGAYLSEVCAVTKQGGRRMSRLPHEIRVVPV